MTSRDLPFGVSLIARTEIALGAAFVIGGTVLNLWAGALAGTPTLFASYGGRSLALIGAVLAVLGALDIAAGVSVMWARPTGYAAAVVGTSLSIGATVYLATLGFLVGLMNLFVNAVALAYLLRGEVRQEYL